VKHIPDLSSKNVVGFTFLFLKYNFESNIKIQSFETGEESHYYQEKRRGF
jgi:hypothetical protein